MATKYRKLEPAQLVCIAREITVAARAVIEMASQMRADASGATTAGQSAYESHQLAHEARELNLAVRAMVDVTTPIREELFIAAKDLRKAKRLRRKHAPKCGAYKASGGRCGTRLEPGQFRCDLHAQELRDRRRTRVAKPNAEGGKAARREVPGKAHTAVNNDAGTSAQPAAGPASILPSNGEG